MTALFQVPVDGLPRLLEHARRLAGAGLPVVPCCRPVGAGQCSAGWHSQPCDRIGKRPLLRDYPQLARTPLAWADLDRALRRAWPCNLAVVTGGSLFAVEADAPEGESELLAIAGNVLDSAPCRERRPGRGRAWLLRPPDGARVPCGAKLGRSATVDVRGESGLLVVAPSLHWSGHVVAWVGGQEPWTVVAPLAPSALLDMVRRGGDDHAGEARPRTAPSVPRAEPSGELPARVAFLIRARLGIERLWKGEGKLHGDCSRSGYDHAVAVELLRAGLRPPDVARSLRARPGAHRTDAAYVERTIMHATASLRGRR